MKIGFVGLGRMGLPMASNLQRKGFSVTGFDLKREAREALAAIGGTGVASAADAARDADVVFTMLPNSNDVRTVVEGEILPVARPGAIIVDMSTIDPLVTDEIAALVAAKGLRFADSPVGRLAIHADRGECLFMVGAAEADFAAIRPLLEAMGTTIHHCGPVGAGMRMKVVNNYLAIAAAQLNAETLTLMARFGLDLEKTIEVLNGTTATNGHLKTNFPVKVLAGDIEPGFQIDLAHKDLGLALTAASAMKVPLSMGSAARECLQLARAGGFGGKDFSGLLDAWCRLAGVEPPRLPGK
ncbi:MAG: NAD(P)-binding domain-containing protein [Aquamicrobium sp.]|uniref:NAD(P)-dependent oxidoreductase n=1 Tax=Aquamicrobium sp. TaxID=1872579 RepID=UPI00349EBD1D|nr:NAD(P)-binding domain-containing protein [Aquamicrobium sp.]